jgi:hypothetical protein
MGEDRSPASGAILELCEEYRLLSDRCAVLDAEFSMVLSVAEEICDLI